MKHYFGSNCPVVNYFPLPCEQVLDDSCEAIEIVKNFS